MYGIPTLSHPEDSDWRGPTPPPAKPGSTPIARPPPTLTRIQAWLSQRIGSVRGAKVVLEVGANVGQDTRWLAAIPGVTVHAFEPDPRNRPPGPVPGSVRWNQCAVAAHVGDVLLHQSGGGHTGQPWTESSSIRRPTGHIQKHPSITFGEPVTVPCTTLDRYTEEHGFDRISLVWADVQGAEALMISGGLVTLARTEWLYTEFSDVELYDGQPTLEAIRAMLPTFDLVEIVDGNALLRNRLPRPEEARTPIYALTSMSPSPAARDVQRAAVESWINAGCEVVAFQSLDEVGAFAPSDWPGVRFVPVPTDGTPFGRSFVPIRTMLQWAEVNLNLDGHALLINADCELLASAEKLRGLATAAADGLCYLQKHDTSGGQAVPEINGIDGFIFRLGALHFPETWLACGKPAWDWVLPWVCWDEGRPLVSPAFPTLLHRKHDVRWNKDEWRACLDELELIAGRSAEEAQAAFVLATTRLTPDPAWPIDTPRDALEFR